MGLHSHPPHTPTPPIKKEAYMSVWIGNEYIGSELPRWSRARGLQKAAFQLPAPAFRAGNRGRSPGAASTGEGSSAGGGEGARPTGARAVVCGSPVLGRREERMVLKES